MQGKTVVITGGTSGIGAIAAQRLAQLGARIVLIARSKSRGKVTLARLNERAPGLAHAVYYADLTRISEMKRVAAEIISQEPRIDVQPQSFLARTYHGLSSMSVTPWADAAA
jgi:retinol dehydrogenase 12